MATSPRHKLCPGLALFLALVLAVVLPSPVAAGGPVLGGSVSPPAWAALPDDGDGASLTATASATWKVVYVVGVVTGSTDLYVSEAQDNTETLRSLGMTVVTFFPPNNAWSDIVAAAADANVLIYAGHGMAWDDTPTVGGLSLDSANRVTPDQIRSDLRMAPNSIVILNHVCYASGSATDPGISSAEAQRRVAQYAEPFLDAGLIGYYSNWYGNFPAKVLTDLAGGMTLGAAYQAFADFDADTVERYTHPSYSGYAMWLDKDNWGGIMYSYAFVGDEGLVLLTAAGSDSTIGMGQASLSLRSEPGAGANTYTFTITVSDGIAVDWTAWLDDGAASWVSISPSSGTSGDVLRLTITVPATAGTYSTRLHLHTDDPRVGEPDVVVPITLVASAPAAGGGYLPLVNGH